MAVVAQQGKGKEKEAIDGEILGGGVVCCMPVGQMTKTVETCDLPLPPAARWEQSHIGGEQHGVMGQFFL
jgi:hypothetical protein